MEILKSLLNLLTITQMLKLLVLIFTHNIKFKIIMVAPNIVFIIFHFEVFNWNSYFQILLLPLYINY